ncbi:MAG: transcriptional regulator [Halobacteriovoraceae bacterium]|nr:transcriptional regulator [Halobacteriovoraceae bacterium]
MQKIDKRAETNRKRKKTVQKSCAEPCPIERGMRLIGGKWKGSILWHLKDKPIRFNELSRLLGGASKKILNERLKEMEENGLLKRVVISDRPIAVSYELTNFGKTALNILEQLMDWCEEHEL